MLIHCTDVLKYTNSALIKNLLVVDSYLSKSLGLK